MVESNHRRLNCFANDINWAICTEESVEKTEFLLCPQSNSIPDKHPPRPTPPSTQMPANANNARRRASPQGAAAAPGLRLAQTLPKPAANAVVQGGSALAVARAHGTAGTVGRRQLLEPLPPEREASTRGSTKKFTPQKNSFKCHF